MKHKRAKQNKKSKKIVVALAAALAAAAALCLWLGVSFSAGNTPRFVADDRAQQIGYGEMDQQDVLANLQAQADKSNFSFKLNSNPVFKTGESEGTLYIENPATNAYGMRVTVTLDETKELVYESGIISPGKGIVRDTLDVPLEKGAYPATATVYAHDPESAEEIGRAAAALVIEVEQ